MKLIRFTFSGIALLAMTACSGITQNLHDSRIGQAISSPGALEFRDRVAQGAEHVEHAAGMAVHTAQEKYRISKFPAMQPVIVRHGTRLAPDTAGITRNANNWQNNIKQNYSVELANGETIIVTQAGPQFHTNQMATLIRHGLNVTLIH